MVNHWWSAYSGPYALMRTPGSSSPISHSHAPLCSICQMNANGRDSGASLKPSTMPVGENSPVDHVDDELNAKRADDVPGLTFWSRSRSEVERSGWQCHAFSRSHEFSPQ